MTKQNCGIYSNQKIHAVAGVLTEQTGTTENSYLYSGEQFDNDLDQYYLRARYYNQSVERFFEDKKFCLLWGNYRFSRDFVFESS